MFSRTIIIAAIIVGFTFANCQKSAPPITSTTDLDTRIKGIFEKTGIAGMSLSVLKNNEIAFQEAYGYANVAKKRPYSLQTTQPIGSVSKLFIAAAILKAVEQGLLTLETPINDILPFAVGSPAFPNEKITMRHLVTHTSGIEDDEDTYRQNYYLLPGTDKNQGIAKRMIEDFGFNGGDQVQPLDGFLKDYLVPGGAYYKGSNFGTSKPGANYSYSNIGAALAAYAVEVSSGESFVSFTKKHIFEPLGMTRTAWHLTDLDSQNAALLYWNKEEPLPNYTFATYPDGALNTCNEDLTKFMLGMMKGQVGQSNFLSSEHFRLLFDQKMATPPSNLPSKEINYGVFWVWFKNGRIGHTGGDAGLFSILAFYPDKQTGFLITSNSDFEDGDTKGKLEDDLQKIINAVKELESL